MNKAALKVQALHAGHQGVEVVRGLSFQVEPGEVVSLLGPNGAGKSTTLLTIAGVLPPLAGTIDIFGAPTRRRPAHALSRAGVALVPEDRGLFAQLNVADNLRLAKKGRVSRTDAVLRDFAPLHDLWRRKVGLLSGGEQQMVALAGALLRGPRLLLLDEMSLGLAPKIVVQLLATVRGLADRTGLAVVLVEQHAQVALSVCDRAMVMRHGELVLQGSASSVRSRLDALEESYMGGDRRA